MSMSNSSSAILSVQKHELLAARLDLEERRYFCIALMSDLITGNGQLVKTLKLLLDAIDAD